MTATKVQWIGVDWGTSNLRAYVIDKSGALLVELESDKGMQNLQPEEFEGALVNLIGPWLTEGSTVPVFACGMVGARQGWMEAKYRPVPCSLLQEPEFTRVETLDPRIEVFILPGLSQASPADVMRGEETQVAGFLASEPHFSGIACLPGTHTKWVDIGNGEIRTFHTFMTGELFSLLSRHSILRHSVSAEGENPSAFLQAALKAAECPQQVAVELFGLRAQSLLEQSEPLAARARLSGMIIGHEIGIARTFWQGRPIALIGSSRLTSLYADVLNGLGADPRIIDTRSATLSGLTIAARQLGIAA